jgi:hypothetical protein
MVGEKPARSAAEFVLLGVDRPLGAEGDVKHPRS